MYLLYINLISYISAQCLIAVRLSNKVCYGPTGDKSLTILTIKKVKI